MCHTLVSINLFGPNVCTKLFFRNMKCPYKLCELIGCKIKTFSMKFYVCCEKYLMFDTWNIFFVRKYCIDFLFSNSICWQQYCKYLIEYVSLNYVACLVTTQHKRVLKCIWLKHQFHCIVNIIIIIRKNWENNTNSLF